MIEGPIGYNGLTLNDQGDRDMLASPFYWFPVRTVDGLFGTELRTEQHPIPGAHRGQSGDFFYNAKTLVISGEVRARTIPYMREAQLALTEAFWTTGTVAGDFHRLDFYLMDGYSAPGVINNVHVYLDCAVNQKLDMPESQETLQPHRRFTVQLIANNPIIYLFDTPGVAYPSWQE